MITGDTLIEFLANLILAFIFLAAFIGIPAFINHLYNTPNLKDFRVCRRLDGAFVVTAKNKLGFWRLLSNMCNMGYLSLRDYEDSVFICNSYWKESLAEEAVNDIVEIIKKGKVKRSNKLKTIKKIKV